MYPKNYKDYPQDTQLKQQQVESGKGIIGCEMHELNGWGSSYHIQEAKNFSTKGHPSQLASYLKQKSLWS